ELPRDHLRLVETAPPLRALVHRDRNDDTLVLIRLRKIGKVLRHRARKPWRDAFTTRELEEMNDGEKAFIRHVDRIDAQSIQDRFAGPELDLVRAGFTQKSRLEMESAQGEYGHGRGESVHLLASEHARVTGVTGVTLLLYQEIERALREPRNAAHP